MVSSDDAVQSSGSEVSSSEELSSAIWLGCFSADDAAPLLESLDRGNPDEIALASSLGSLVEEGLWAADDTLSDATHPLSALCPDSSTALTPTGPMILSSAVESSACAALACLWSTVMEALSVFPCVSERSANAVVGKAVARFLDALMSHPKDSRGGRRSGGQQQQQQQPPASLPVLDTSALLLQLEESLFVALRTVADVAPIVATEEGDAGSEGVDTNVSGGSQHRLARIESTHNMVDDDMSSDSLDSFEDEWRMSRPSSGGRLGEDAFWSSAQASLPA
jgi:hypothetical protein